MCGITALVNLDDPARLDAVRSNMKYGFLSGLSTPSRVAQRLARYIAWTGDITAIDALFTGERAVTEFATFYRAAGFNSAHIRPGALSDALRKQDVERYYGSYWLCNGYRLHFYPDSDTKKVYVGYIGPHLRLK